VLHQGFGLAVTDNAGGMLHAFGKVGRTILEVVRIAGENGHGALLQQGVG